MDDFFNAVDSWWAQPFNSDMSVKGWALFLGLVIVLIIGWNLILKFIVGEA